MLATAVRGRWTRTGGSVAERRPSRPGGSFEALLGPARWSSLLPSIRRRFDGTAGEAGTTIYTGEIVHAEVSVLGWILAQLARLIGGPLPTARDIAVPATVVVAPAHDGSGQIWTRLYGRRAGFPQAIHSIKRFAGPTGLEEYLGCGFGIALTLDCQPHLLTFASDHYFVQMGKVRMRLPEMLSPGRLTISHEDLGGGRFAFRLHLEHPRLGCLMNQIAIFADAKETR